MSFAVYSYARRIKALLSAVLLICLVGHFSNVSAQFGIKIPKIPGIGKDVKDTKDNVKNAPKGAPAPQPPTPEVSAVSPNVVPPGWNGEVTFAGKNFLPTLAIHVDCDNYVKITTSNLRVDGNSKATVKFELPSPERSGDNQEAK